MKLGLSYVDVLLTRQHSVEDSRKVNIETFPEHLSHSLVLIASSLSLDLHIRRQITASPPQLFSTTDDSTFHTHIDM